MPFQAQRCCWLVQLSGSMIAPPAHTDVSGLGARPHLGRKQLCGAQTGTVMISQLPGAWPERPGSATLPFFGVVPVIVDDKARAGFLGLCAGPTGLRSRAFRRVCLL